MVVWRCPVTDNNIQLSPCHKTGRPDMPQGRKHICICHMIDRRFPPLLPIP
ncbi:hypothetical protein SXCC_02843 [Gluconacetobacter sp. SXCC-1]|nr:hypothetical protein SXCC_02843 [Gluconacetobacter sp. SXCC-1]